MEEKKKLGIITFHRAINYGAVLQTYALNKATQRLGYDSEVINYRYNRVDKGYILFSSKSLKRKLTDLYYYPIKRKKIKKFEKFINEKIDLSKETYITKKELEGTQNIYDIYLTGSDQVFNYRITDKDDNYLLSFVTDSKKKNSYAASFGRDSIQDEYKEKFKKELQTFNKISVRESKGIDIVKDLCDKEVRIDVDPTYLLEKKDWQRISVTPKEKGYILLFLMQKNDSIYKFTEKLSKETGLPIIYITDSYKKMVKGKHKRTVSPEEWVGYFENADYVVTNSFHGLAFSVNLNKQFYVELQKEPATGNSRLSNLLEEYNLQDRLIVNGENNNRNKISWKKVNEKLKQNREKSMEYLKGLYDE